MISAPHSESATIMVCARTQPRLVRARGTRGGSEAGARRRPGLGVAREAREAGVSLGMRRTGATTLDTPFSPAWGTVAGLRGLGLAAAQGFSRPGVPQKSAVASAAREAGAAQHPHRGTASARPALVSPLRSLGEGGVANQMPVSRGGGADTSLWSKPPLQSSTRSPWELWEL